MKRAEALVPAFAAHNEHPFGVWAYSTPEPLEAVLAKGYFKGCHSRLRLGDLVFCGVAQGDRYRRDSKRDQRRCLLMVSSLALDGIEVRLLQDWGTPDGPALPPGPDPAVAGMVGGAVPPPQGPTGEAKPGARRRRVAWLLAVPGQPRPRRAGRRVIRLGGALWAA